MLKKIIELTTKNNRINDSKKVIIRKRSPADFEPHEWEIICRRVDEKKLNKLYSHQTPIEKDV